MPTRPWWTPAPSWQQSTGRASTAKKQKRNQRALKIALQDGHLGQNQNGRFQAAEAAGENVAQLITDIGQLIAQQAQLNNKISAINAQIGKNKQTKSTIQDKPSWSASLPLLLVPYYSISASDTKCP